MEIKKTYRYCIVPVCTNTTITTPEKYFFHVPNDKKVRNKWCSLMRREKALSTKTSRHCCEDHFNIETDTENYLRWRLCGGTLKLKQGAVPTKFDCQQRKRTSRVIRLGYEKRQKIEFFETLLTKEVRPSVPHEDIEFISCNNELLDVDQPANPLPSDNTIKIDLHNPEKKSTKDKRIPVEPLKKDVLSQTITQRKKFEFLSQNIDSGSKSEFSKRLPANIKKETV